MPYNTTKPVLRISDEMIYNQLLGDVEVGNNYISTIPDRPKPDTNASFGLFEQDGYVKWKDYGIPEPKGNRAIDLYMHYRRIDNYFKAIEQCNQEFHLAKLKFGDVLLKRAAKSDVVPFIQQRDQMTDFELEYWFERFQITEEECRAEDVYGLEFMAYQDGYKAVESTPTDPAFFYLLQKNPYAWKIYRPLTEDKARKFRHSGIRNLLEGWSSFIRDFDPSKPTIICPSTKDRLVMKHTKEWNTVNPTNEMSYAGIAHHAPEIKALVGDKPVYVLYDGDPPGWTSSLVLEKKHGYVPLPAESMFGEGGEPSDFIDSTKVGGSYEELISIINNSLLKYHNI